MHKPRKTYARKELKPTKIDQRIKRRAGRTIPFRLILGVTCLVLLLVVCKMVIPNIINRGRDVTSNSLSLNNDNNTTADKTDSSSNLVTDAQNKTVYYYYNFLSTVEKEKYSEILSGYLNYQKDIKTSVDENELNHYVLMILADHPELFWVEGAYEYTSYSTERYIVLHPQYNCTEKEKKQRDSEIQANTEQIIEELLSIDDEYKQAKRVFEYLIDSIEYELDAPDNQNIYSSLVNKRSVCAGYSRATQYLLQKCGITALYVSGEVTDRGLHAWNIIECDKEYYQIDTTFGDSNYTNSINGADLELPHELTYDYAYLCCDDNTLYRNRKCDEELPVPSCASMENNYYLRNGLYFTAYTDEVTDSIINSVRDNRNSWSCQFANYQAYSELLENLKDGLYSDIVIENVEGIDSIETHYSYDDATYTIKTWY